MVMSDMRMDLAMTTFMIAVLAVAVVIIVWR